MAEPIAYVTTRHRCPHCRKSYAHKAGAQAHMLLCFADPARRTCKTCVHDEPAYYDYGADQYFDRACAKDERNGPSCVGCGEHPEVCRCDTARPPATQLRVLCPTWEAKP
jgi:hypothetical protein